MSTLAKTPFGQLPDGSRADLFTFTNARGLIAKVTNYGGHLTELHVPDRAGNLANVVLGFDNLAQYLAPHPSFGATIGRVANRIGHGTFTLGGKTYHLPLNAGSSTIHGGPKGFEKYLWHAAVSGDTLTLTLDSPDGDMGFPGNLRATVSFTLNDESELVITFAATADQPTPVNMCNHAYFNLAGAGEPSILDHILYLNAHAYTLTDANQVPTGQIAPVAGTPMDFNTTTTIGARIGQVTGGGPAGGYDHNYVLNHAAANPHDLILAATVTDPKSGRVMDVLTTQPGVQLYTANNLNGSITGNGGRYLKQSALCLETQHFPDSVHHAHFPSTIIHPGQTYHERAVYRFRTA